MSEITHTHPFVVLWSKAGQAPGEISVAMGNGAGTPLLIAAAHLLDQAATDSVGLAVYVARRSGFSSGSLELAGDDLILQIYLDGTRAVLDCGAGRPPTELELWIASTLVEMMARNEIAKRIAGNEMKRAQDEALLRSIAGDIRS